jgi:hypothetical protein
VSRDPSEAVTNSARNGRRADRSRLGWRVFELPHGRERGKAMDEEPRGKNDLAAKLYIAFGVPAIILFMVVLFSFTRSCGIPA